MDFTVKFYGEQNRWYWRNRLFNDNRYCNGLKYLLKTIPHLEMLLVVKT